MGINTPLALTNFIQQKMRRLNLISLSYSFESTKISIWFGACKMLRLTRALVNLNNLEGKYAKKFGAQSHLRLL